MPVRVNRATVAWIENKQSRFGCGAADCFSCYPLQYRCDWCSKDFSLPVLNTRPGSILACEDCGLDEAVIVK